MMTPVKQKQEDQSKVTPTKVSPCKVANEANEAIAKEAKGAKWPFTLPEVIKAPKANARAGTKDTSKADNGWDNATEAGAKRKASNGMADSAAPKKRPAAKGHRSRARIPVPATPKADSEASGVSGVAEVPEVPEPEVPAQATPMELETELPEVVSEVSGVSGVAEVPGVPVQATPMELETELPEVVSEVAGGFEVSGLATLIALTTPLLGVQLLAQLMTLARVKVLLVKGWLLLALAQLLRNALGSSSQIWRSAWS